MTDQDIIDRLEDLRLQLRNGNMSYSELVELQTLVEYIDCNDKELLEWAGVPEFDDTDLTYTYV